MSDWFTITGIKPWDGRYELDPVDAPLTAREWGWIKRLAGYLPVTLTGEAYTDPELITVLAVVAMRRAGTIQTEQVAEVWERFSDAPFGAAITHDSDPVTDGEGDAGPPDRKHSGRLSSNGDSSPTGSESSDAPPTATGNPPSGTSVSVPATSVS